MFYSWYLGYEENDERSNEEEKSTSSTPIGEGMNTGKLSNPVSDSSDNGIVMVGSISRPILERAQILAFVTLSFMERRLEYLPEIIGTSPASSAFDWRRRRTVGNTHTLRIFPLRLNWFSTSCTWYSLNTSSLSSFFSYGYPYILHSSIRLCLVCLSLVWFRRAVCQPVFKRSLATLSGLPWQRIIYTLTLWRLS